MVPEKASQLDGVVLWTDKECQLSIKD